jgi:hypothetical protein
MFDFPELDYITREHMLREFRAEQMSELGPYRPKGYVGDDHLFVGIMERALTEGDEESLIEELTLPHLWDEYVVRETRRGPVPAIDRYDVQARRFGITEYNTWYVRGLTKRLLEEGVRTCEVFRADRAYRPRQECRRLEGMEVATLAIYEGHRLRYHHVHEDPRGLSIPIAPNCHHSIRRPALAT